MSTNQSGKDGCLRIFVQYIQSHTGRLKRLFANQGSVVFASIKDSRLFSLFSDQSKTSSKKQSALSKPVIIALIAGGSVVVIVLVLCGVFMM